MAPYCSDGHIQRPGDFIDIQVFPVTKNDHRSRFLRKGCDQSAELAPQQRIGFRLTDGHLRQFFELNFMSEARFSPGVNAPMDGRSPQPRNTVRARFDRVPTFIQLQEDVLRDFLRNRSVAEEVPGDAVNHGLMLLNAEFKIGLRHLPSYTNNEVEWRHYAKDSFVETELMSDAHGFDSKNERQFALVVTSV